MSEEFQKNLREKYLILGIAYRVTNMCCAVMSNVVVITERFAERIRKCTVHL